MVVVYLCVDDSDFVSSKGTLPIGFHAFLAFENASDSAVKLDLNAKETMELGPGEMFTLSTWGNKLPYGLWVNMEPAMMCHNSAVYEYRGSICLSEKFTDCLELQTRLSDFLKTVNLNWYILNNSADFALAGWNAITKRPLKTDATIRTIKKLASKMYATKEYFLYTPQFPTNDKVGWYNRDGTIDWEDVNEEFLYGKIASQFSSFSDTNAIQTYAMSSDKKIKKHVMMEGCDIEWDDLPEYMHCFLNGQARFPQGIRMGSCSFIDAFQVVYEEVALAKHGVKEAATTRQYDLAPGEYIQEIICETRLWSSRRYVTYLKLVTNVRQFVLFSSVTGYEPQRFEFTAPPDRAIVCFGGAYAANPNAPSMTGFTVYHAPI